MSSESEWADEDPMLWLILNGVTLGVVTQLGESSGLVDGAIYVVWVVLAVAALYGTYLAITHNDD